MARVPDFGRRISRSYSLVLSGFWTGAILASFGWNVHVGQQKTLETAQATAAASSWKDEQYRHWSASHGGLYMESDEPAGPTAAPQATTAAGRPLVRVSAATMARLVATPPYPSDAVHSHLTSLTPKNPDNAPDAWERAALLRLTSGEASVTELVESTGGAHGRALRVMQPLRVEQSCLECHAEEQLGDLRGAVVVDVPMAPLEAAEDAVRFTLIMGHSALWLFGVGIIVSWRRRFRASLGSRREADLARREMTAVQAVMDGVLDPVVFIDADHRVRQANPAAREFYHLDGPAGDVKCHQAIHRVASCRECEVDCCPLESAQRTGGPVRFVHIHHHRTLGARAVEILARPAYDEDGTFKGIIKTARDVTEREETARRLEHMARSDALTGVPNRACFEEHLRAVLTDPQQPVQVSVLFVDMDRFKNINDTLGHGVGDQILVQAAARLRMVVPAMDMVARFGGDEFTVLLRNRTSQEVHEVAHAVVHALAAPFSVDHYELHATASVGVSSSTRDGLDATSLLRCADTALYRAKGAGRNNVHFYAGADQVTSRRRLEMEHALHGAVQRGEIDLFYQAQVRASDGVPMGMEALARWNHPVLGPVSPAEFIPLAEETGLITALGSHVLAVACAQAKVWNDGRSLPLQVAVNVSARQLLNTDLAAEVASVLNRTGLAPELLELEITETVLMEDMEQAAIMLRRLKALGVSVALDDFGTGHSSMGYLKHLPIDVLKVDQVFVRDLPHGLADAAMVQAVVTLAVALGLSVVAEGVETREQHLFLERLGCHVLQGYLFAPPLSGADFQRRFVDGAPAFRPAPAAKTA